VTSVIQKKAYPTETFINCALAHMFMEFIVLSESKTELVFQLKGETHTFCNMLKAELQKVKGVEIATYNIDHPLIGVPQFMIQTKGTEPRKALKTALKAISSVADQFVKEIKSL